MVGLYWKKNIFGGSTTSISTQVSKVFFLIRQMKVLQSFLGLTLQLPDDEEEQPTDDLWGFKHETATLTEELSDFVHTKEEKRGRKREREVFSWMWPLSAVW